MERFILNMGRFINNQDFCSFHFLTLCYSLSASTAHLSFTHLLFSPPPLPQRISILSLSPSLIRSLASLQFYF